jgi:thioredoxin-dependent peroxiredoxin
MAKKKIAKKAAKKVVKQATKKTSKKTSKTNMTRLPQVGEEAPAFSLQDQDGNKVSLDQFRGSYLLIYFYPRAMTPGCTVQACGLRDSEKELKKLGVVTIGISPDGVGKLKQFAEKHHLNFTLLSDPDHQTAESYGCWGLKKFMGREFMGILRQSFLIDPTGRILHVMQKVQTKTHHQDCLEILKRL